MSALGVLGPELGQIVQGDDTVFVCPLCLLRGPVNVWTLAVLGPLAGEEFLLQRGHLRLFRTIGQVEGAKDHVLGWRGKRLSVCRREDVVA